MNRNVAEAATGAGQIAQNIRRGGGAQATTESVTESQQAAADLAPDERRTADPGGPLPLLSPAGLPRA
jgi:hypothetical protein